MVLLFIGGSEIFVIALIIVMFFGADKIPELARGLGKGIRQIKDASEDIKREIRESAGQEIVDDLKSEINSAKKSMTEFKHKAYNVREEVAKSVPELNELTQAKSDIDEIKKTVETVKGAVKRNR